MPRLAVQAVQNEPVSTVDFRVQQRKTGKFCQMSPDSTPRTPYNMLIVLVSLAKFPKQSHYTTLLVFGLKRRFGQVRVQVCAALAGW